MSQKLSSAAVVIDTLKVKAVCLLSRLPSLKTLMVWVTTICRNTDKINTFISALNIQEQKKIVGSKIPVILSTSILTDLKVSLC